MEAEVRDRTLIYLRAFARLNITMHPMPDAYTKLLDAVIQHLEDQIAQGNRFISVSPEALHVLLSSNTKAAAKKYVAATAGQTVPSSIPVARSKTLDKPLIVAPKTAEATVRSQCLDPTAKAAAFAELRQRAMACVKCPHLATSRKNVVFGVGDIHAELMFVGEAPGADEDAQGEPFVGRAGQLLTKIIETMGLNRGSVYIANILKCRPDTPGQPTGNRKPSPEEMQTCIPYLHEQIDLIQPKVIVALGGTAIEGLLGKTMGITRLRGTWQSYRNVPLMPTYHPSYLLRNQVLTEKRRVWEDMLQVMEKLQMEISDKQRNFFLKGN
jgi:uracil-DNA glycosylase family 4